MPTLFLFNGIRFFFYSNENDEPIHVHVTKGGANGKIWLEPSLKVEYMIEFSNAEEKDIFEIIETHLEQFKKKWNDYFSN